MLLLIIVLVNNSHTCAHSGYNPISYFSELVLRLLRFHVIHLKRRFFTPKSQSWRTSKCNPKADFFCCEAMQTDMRKIMGQWRILREESSVVTVIVVFSLSLTVVSQCHDLQAQATLIRERQRVFQFPERTNSRERCKLFIAIFVNHAADKLKSFPPSLCVFA